MSDAPDQLLGANLAYFSTRFIGTIESQTPVAYKEMLLTARAADIVHTAPVSGVPASFMRQSLENARHAKTQHSSAGQFDPHTRSADWATCIPFLIK
ncbi:hypothetical protein TU82_27255 [Pseudomonas orientalis]|nr:hypothetical protein TU82_27255 [Pseudomonas orientalis]